MLFPLPEMPFPVLLFGQTFSWEPFCEDHFLEKAFSKLRGSVPLPPPPGSNRAGHNDYIIIGGRLSQVCPLYQALSA